MSKLRITKISVFRANIPLVAPFRIALGVISDAESLFVRIDTDSGVAGWGEASLVSQITGETQATSLAAAVGIGVVGIARVGSGLAVFIVVGVALNCGYNLELFGGRFHNDVTFAAAWGAFPVLTGYYVQAATLSFPGVAAAAAAYCLSAAQRSLSTPARELRRRIASVEGTVTYHDGRAVTLTRSVLLAPAEAALKAMAWGMVSLAVALVLYRCMNK